MAEQLPSWDTHNIESLRQFSRIRLIVGDLDGTLVQPSDFNLYKSILNLRRSLSSYQVSLTLATGRTLTGLRPLLDKLLLPKDMPLILYNGSVVVKNEKFRIIYQKKIPADTLRAILKISYNFGVQTLAYIYGDPTHTWFQFRETFEYVLGWSSTKRPEREFNNMPVRWQDKYTVDNNAEFSAILIDISECAKDARIIEAEINKITDISISKGSSSYIEIRPRGSNKGIALEFVATFLNLSKDEILTLGDNDNDAEMLAWAGIGVAIAEASPRALASSDYVCRHRVAEGAIEVLRLVKNARRYFFQPSKDSQGVR